MHECIFACRHIRMYACMHVLGPYNFLEDISMSDNSSQTYSKSNQYMCSYFPPLTNWEPPIRERPLARRHDAKGATKFMASGPPG